MPSDKIIDVEDLAVTLQAASFTERPRKVLDGVTFDLDKGQALAILGRTASGKSILCRALTRFFYDVPIRDISGEVMYEGKNLIKTSQTKLLHLRGSRIAYVLQNAHRLFNPQLTIQQQFNTLLKFKKPKLKNRMDHAIDYLYRVGMVDPESILLTRTFPEELDAATRQKLMIASALSCEPRLLIADEITAEFDSVTVGQIVDAFEHLKNERGMSVIFATGRVRRAEQFGDKIGVLEHGELVEAAGPRELFDKGEHAATRAFVDGTLLAGTERERLVSHYYH